MKVAYIMSRFPKLTETFILYEILAVEAQGTPVEIFPLLRERQAVAHPEAARLVARAHYLPFFSWNIWRAQMYFLLRRPRTTLRMLWEVLSGTAGSLNFFAGALGVLPKSMRFAYDMERLGVTHVHAHFATHPTVAALVVHRLTGIPYSFTAHGSDLHVRRRMLERKVEAAAFAVTISEYNKNVMVTECGAASRDKIHVVHCGVDPQVFAVRASAPPAGPLRILCVASFEEVKGHRYLLDACALLRDRGVPFECHLVGDGPLRSAVEARIASLGLGAFVHVHGPQPRLAVVRALHEAAVFALPSVPTRGGKREGIPVVLMEAMASGLPVVTSRLSGIPELVEHEVSGYLVEPGDAAGIAAALAALAQDPAWRTKLGEAGAARVRRDFDLRQNAATLARLFAARAHVPEDVPCSN
jgi:colanic acid/amylovoran biosynthesis glycosyltransferase